ncbi:MAG: hypothetical protein E7348_03390 [Clostridiales bacterium]|nr:hypothetical protein [Clostridiales bacterium]
MKQRRYFDVAATIGRRQWRPDFPYKPQDLIDDMAYARVHGALCFNAESLDYSYVAANREMIKASKENKRILSAAMIPAAYKYEAGSDYLKELTDSGVKTFYFAPDRMRNPLNAIDYEPIAEYMIRNNMPLLIQPDYTNYRDFKEFLTAFPELKVIAVEYYWQCNRQLFMLLEKHANLYFEVGGNQSNDCLAFVKRNFGINRALFGTQWPVRSMSAIKALVEYADVSEQDKDLVAFGNAKRLFNLNEEDFPLYDDKDCKFDELARKVDVGEKLDIPIFDVHSHIIPEEDRTTTSVVYINGGIDSVIKNMDKFGIDKIITAPMEGITTNGINANEQVLDFAKKYPGRVYGFATANIHEPEDMAVVNEYHKKYPEIFVGIKPYWPNQQFDMLDERLDEWFSYANENKMFLLWHMDESQIDKAEKLADKYPEIRFILAHAGFSYDVARGIAKIAKTHPNVYADITITICTRKIIEYLVQEMGEDRVLFATDLPLRELSTQIAWVCYADISVEAKKKIMGENMFRLLEEYNKEIKK